MKPWHLIVTGLYVLLLAALTVPLLVVGIGLEFEGQLFAKVFGSLGVWLIWGVFALCQLVLLAVPVRIAHRRPVTRGSLWPTVTIGAAALAFLVFGAALSLSSAILGDELKEPLSMPLIVPAVACTWLLWAGVFWRMSVRRPAADFLSVVCRRLFQGSILELLIAVPCHVVVRHRADCCAGIFTMIGLAAGVSVMLLAFGPALYFLFVARAERLQAALPVEKDQNEDDEP